jgi:NSS family neurotransmitter:Na+ symporter
MAQIQGVPINSIVDSGFGLAFIALPKALELLPFGKSLFATLFFVALFTLAFTSIVAMMESILGGLMNLGLRIKRSTYLLLISLTAFLIGLLYMRQNGMYVMDIVGYFGNYSIMFVVMVQAIAVGWVYNAQRLRTELNKNSGANISPVFDVLLKYVIPPVLFGFMAKQFFDDITQNYSNFSTYYLLVYGVGTLVLIGVAGVVFTWLDRRNQ